MHLTNSFYEYKFNFPKLWGRLLYILLVSALVFSILIIIFTLPLIKDYIFPVRVLIAIFCAFPVLFNANSLVANHLYTHRSKPKPLVLRNLFSTILGIIVLFISVYIFNLGYLGFIFGAATTAIISFIIFIKPLWINEELYPRVEKNIIRLKSNLKQSFPVIPHALGFVLISSSLRIILENYDVFLKEIGLFSNGYMIGDYIAIITTALVTSIVALMQKFYKSADYCLFRMNEGLDKGDIYQQLPLSLAGTLDDIFRRISDLGLAATCNIIEGNYTLIAQNDSQASYFKRRSPKDSEITIEELANKTSEFLYNKVRMLADPFPNAYIKTVDGRKLIIKSVEVE